MDGGRWPLKPQMVPEAAYPLFDPLRRSTRYSIQWLGPRRRTIHGRVKGGTS